MEKRNFGFDYWCYAWRKFEKGEITRLAHLPRLVNFIFNNYGINVEEYAFAPSPEEGMKLVGEYLRTLLK